MIHTVVIGGGLMGSAAAWQLAKRNIPVLLLEKQPQHYSEGSSLGQARISRTLGVKNDLFSYLQRLSVQETESLMTYMQLHDPDDNHNMSEIYTTSPVTYLYHNLKQAQVRQFNDIHLDYALSPEDAFNKFGMTIPPNLQVVREFMEYSGTINPNILIKKLHKAIQLAGGTIRYEQEVNTISEEHNHYRLNVKSGNKSAYLTCSHIICAAGPYTGPLLHKVAPYFEQLIDIKRIQLAFFKPDPAHYKALSGDKRDKIRSSFPVIELDQDFFYAMNEGDDRTGIPLFKVGGHFRRSNIDNLDKSWYLSLDADEIEWSNSKLLRYFRLLKVPIFAEHLHLERGYSCTYSLTTSEIPFVTPLLDQNGNTNPKFIVIAGLSGVGAKAALAYGLLANELLLNEKDNQHQHGAAHDQMGITRLRQDIEHMNRPKSNTTFHQSLGL